MERDEWHTCATHFATGRCGYVEVQDVFRQFKMVTGLAFHDLDRGILHILTDELQDGQC